MESPSRPPEDTGCRFLCGSQIVLRTRRCYPGSLLKYCFPVSTKNNNRNRKRRNSGLSETDSKLQYSSASLTVKTRRGGCYSCFMVAGVYAVSKLVAVSWRASDCVDTQNLVRMALRCYGATGRQRKSKSERYGTSSDVFR